MNVSPNTQAPVMNAKTMIINNLLFLLAIHVLAIVIIVLVMILVKPWVIKKWPEPEHRKARENLIRGITIGYCLAVVLGWAGRALAPYIMTWLNLPAA